MPNSLKVKRGSYSVQYSNLNGSHTAFVVNCHVSKAILFSITLFLLQGIDLVVLEHREEEKNERSGFFPSNEN